MPESFRSSSRRGSTVTLLAAVALFLAAWGVPQLFAYNHPWRFGDTKTYEEHGNRTIAHEIPYRDFSVEYPPGALPMFVLPIVLHKISGYHGYYAMWFRILMAVCGIGAIVGMWLALLALRAPPRRLRAALFFAALAPALLGVVVTTRYDYWPAALGVLALAALLWELDLLAFAFLGAGFAAKVYPAVLLPLALVEVWRRRGARGVALGLASFAVVAAAAFGPFLVWAPHGLWESLWLRQASRPLQLESLAAAVLLVAKHVFGIHLHHVTSHGSDNLVGGLPHALASLLTVLQLAALAAVWTLFARGRGGKERLVLASAAAVTAFIAFDKVFSPQYFVWLIVLVPLVYGAAGLRASVLLAVALALTQAYYPWRYDDLTHRWDAWASWLIFVRDLVVLALLAVLVRTLARDRGSTDAVVSG
jgi:hypothetical protein